MEELDKMWQPYKTYEKEEGRSNIITQCGDRSSSLMAITHLDVVPVGEG